MKRLLRAAAVVLAVLVAGVGWWLLRPNPSGMLGAPDPALIQDGDVLMIRTDTWRGRLLRLAGISDFYTHVGIIQLRDGSAGLLHADPEKGCVRESLDDFCRRTPVYELRVLRRPLATEQIDAVLAFANRQAAVEAPFNHSFRYRGKDSFCCTELVVAAFAAAGVAECGSVEPETRISPDDLVALWGGEYLLPVSGE